MTIQSAIKAFLSDSPMPIHEYAFLSPEKIPFSADVRKACEDNLCGRYGKSWTCPPGAGDWQELKERYQSYGNAFVFTTLHKVEDSFDFEGMDEASKVHSEAEEALLAHIAPWAGQFELLGAGSCSLCEECTYPDAPCRFPEQARRSMEACGIDVVTLSKENNIRYFNGANTVTYFSVLLY